MKTTSELADLIRAQLRSLRLTQTELASTSGVARRTLAQVLRGDSDLKLSTLFALADRIGLEVVLVPKTAADGIAAGPATPAVKSHVDVVLENLRGTESR